MAKLAINGGKPVRTRPFVGWPQHDEREVEAVAAVVRSGHWGGFPEPGPEAGRFAERFAAMQGARYGITMANGTVTLAVALQAAGIGWGDEVIVPGCTFAATAWAVLNVGAVPIIADVDAETFCLDVSHSRELVSERTRAIIPVHLGMSMADMDGIMALAREHNLVVIEDSAHAHGMRWEADKGAGAIGHFGSFSLQSSKLLTSGEGGILITNDRELAERAHSIVDCGRPKDDAGKRYTLGANYRITELQAALLNAQMDRFEEQMARRIPNVQYLDAELTKIDGIRVQKVPPHVIRRSGYNYILVFDRTKFSGIDNATFCEALAAEGLVSGTGYEPMNDYSLFRPTPENNPVAHAFGDRMNLHSVRLPVAEMLGKASVWLSHSPFLGTREDMDDIVTMVQKIRDNAWELG